MGQPLQRTGECHSCGGVLQEGQYYGRSRHHNPATWKSGRTGTLFILPGNPGCGSDEKRNQLYYSMDVPCSELTQDNQCRVHDSPMKPLICLRFPSSKEDIEDIPDCGYGFQHDLPGLVTARRRGTPL